jgi:hypothetical protein
MWCGTFPAIHILLFDVSDSLIGWRSWLVCALYGVKGVGVSWNMVTYPNQKGGLEVPVQCHPMPSTAVFLTGLDRCLPSHLPSIWLVKLSLDGNRYSYCTMGPSMPYCMVTVYSPTRFSCYLHWMNINCNLMRIQSPMATAMANTADTNVFGNRKFPTQLNKLLVS